MQRIEYALKPDFDPVTHWAYKFRNSQSYSGVTYGKTATLLATLESIIGRDTMDEAMRTYFMKFRFTHPTAEDFLRTIEQVAVARGRATILPAGDAALGVPVGFADVPPVNSSLRRYFNQAVYGTQVLDYTVDSVTSSPVQWWVPLPDDKDARKQVPYLSTVYLHRKGDFVLRLRWRLCSRRHTAARPLGRRGTVDKADLCAQREGCLGEIDPDHVVLMDVDLFNNSYTTKANRVPARKLSTIWASAQQLFAQLVTWIV